MRVDDPSKHAGLTSPAKPSEERPLLRFALWAAVSVSLAPVGRPRGGRGRGQQSPSKDEFPPGRTRWSPLRLTGERWRLWGSGEREGKRGGGEEGRGGAGGVKGRVREIHLFTYC